MELFYLRTERSRKNYGYMGLRMTTPEKKRLHLRVFGRVQGVYYRASTCTMARSLLLRGWVCNRPDGSVEIIAEGTHEQLAALLNWSRQGPPGAYVERVQSTYGDAQCDLKPFFVRY